MTPLIEVRNVTKMFPGVRALDNVCAALGRGEVLAVVGENGAGKSTLMKVMAGVYIPDAGDVRVDGAVAPFKTVSDAMACGVSLIHQELNLAENLSVTDNIFLGRERTTGGVLKILARRTMRSEAVRLMARVGLAAELADVPCRQLSPGQRQLVEIARALSLSVRVMIMDEPTSSLTQTETDRLYHVIDELKAAGVGIVYISHRLVEVKRVADRVIVLRDGRNAGELAKQDISHDALVRLMVGREISQLQNRLPPAKFGADVLAIDSLAYLGGPAPVSFRLRAGEILGTAGLVGAGRTELAEAVFGIRPSTGGDIRVAGEPVAIRSPQDAIAAGLSLVPEDRRLHGLVIEQTIRFNLTLPTLDTLSVLRLVSLRRERELSAKLCEQLKVRTTDDRKVVGQLSGGNQQKVVLGKWLAASPKVLILDEPTRGVDVGARSEIYALMNALTATGVGIWMISSDMEELLGMSDRILVLHEGRVSGTLERGAFSEEAVMTLATGGRTDIR